MNEYIYTVSKLNLYIKEVFSGDINLMAITLKGEISNFTNHIKTGHYYFTLKDGSSSIRAIMFKGNASKIKFRVENGMNVVVMGSIQVFERDGVYQVYCTTMQPDGIGALYLAFEQLKERLLAIGLFDDEHKKSIPHFPQKIGIVTSKTGAALQDILNILTRRYPIGTVVIIPVLVQGENAASSIVAGIKRAQQTNIDVLIVGRGGGSIEDLWAFNEEIVANAIYDCTIPIISAVGHEIDFTIADFVADLRAPTPSAAAELCAPDVLQLSRDIEAMQSIIYRNVVDVINTQYDDLKAAHQRLFILSPENRVKQMEQELILKQQRLGFVMQNIIRKYKEKYQNNVLMLEALSPLKVITRGYSITYGDSGIVNSIGDISPNELIKTKLVDGEITSKVLKVTSI